MQKKNARLPEGKTSALDSANANTTAAHLVHGGAAAVARENSSAATRGTDKTDRSPRLFRNTTPSLTDKTDGSPLVSVASVTPAPVFEKMRLHGVNRRAYTFCVAETKATEIGVSNCIGGQPPTGGIFSSAANARLQWSGLGGGALAHAGSYAPVRQPRHVPGHPIGVGAGLLNPA
ncbi:hypothetical protein BX592_113100 [Paraburkholderia rhizosphaerae]|uniref:Uncharacterized protein n=1 Tax=Paraburkholderia rhizosphaerae TaxID=480658 RepID=A0A4R8LPV5_9BURK|nr:hypothetical protein BX592_113100 [Paraburkholderia rhizosphaerae]